MTFRRRTVLAAIGTTLATTGCLGAASPESGDGADPADSPTDMATDTPTETPTPDGPYPEYPDSIRDADCPSFSDTDRTVCNHTRSADADLYPSVSSPVYDYVRGNNEVESVTVTLHNGTDQRFGFNPYGWSVKRQSGDSWEHVAPEAWPEPWTYVQPGETYHWELSTESHPSPNLENTQYPVVPDLESGLHAFTVSGLLGKDDPASVECVALFEVGVRAEN